jgi:hypothetical protein
MKALLDINGRDRRPHNVAPDCWYYEESGGLAVYFRYPGKSDVVLVGIIPWRSIRASLKRNDARRLKRSAKKTLSERSHRAVLRESDIAA